MSAKAKKIRRKLGVFPMMNFRTVTFTACGILMITIAVLAQEPAAPQRGQGGGRGGGRGPQIPQVVSPEVSTDRKIIFRIAAPQAQSVRLTATDIPNLGQSVVLTKAENGVWSTTVGPVEPGAYRYNFNVDGVATIDPRSPAISESNANAWSLVYIPGADFMDRKTVPHGSVAAVNYFSTTLNAWRRLHVYTPPGYETGNDKYPVLYLLHGAGDSDHSWTSVGRAK
jgi:enterochelin esterase family protein